MINYCPTPTATRLHADRESLVRALLGPVGSGKSVAMVSEILWVGMNQAAHPITKKRRTAWAVCRNVYNELVRSTIKTMREWIPPAPYSNITMAPPPTGTIKFDLPDGTRVEIDLMFFALDQEGAEGKLRSCEYTGFWFNEAQFLDPEIFRVLVQRTGRFPRKEEDANGNVIFSGATWRGGLIDFNAQDKDHWLYKTFVEEKPPEYMLYTQPPALLEIDDPSFDAGKGGAANKVWVPNPSAENIKSHATPANKDDGYNYYRAQLIGATRDKILRDVCGIWADSKSGHAVFGASFSRDAHVSKEALVFDPSLPLLGGIDFGLRPAMVLGQIDRMGRLNILDAIYPDTDSGTSTEELVDDYIMPLIVNKYTSPHLGPPKTQLWGDPYGKGRSNIDKRSPYIYLASRGLFAKPVTSNDFLPRKEAVEKFLQKRNGFCMDKSLTWLIKAISSDYRYGKTHLGLTTEPLKTKPSDIADALQYLCHGLLHSSDDNKAAPPSKRKRY